MKKALRTRSESAYELRLGFSDVERASMLAAREVSGILITLQGYAEVQRAAAAMKPLVVHVFAQSASAEGSEHILINREARARDQWRWALPERGFEKSLVRRIDPAVTESDRIVKVESRPSSIQAVARGEADACIADLGYAMTVLGESSLRILDCLPLAAEIWTEFWTVLLIPSDDVEAEPVRLRKVVQQLSIDAATLPQPSPVVARYPSLKEARELILTGQVMQIFHRWGGQILPMTAELLS